MLTGPVRDVFLALVIALGLALYGQKLLVDQGPAAIVLSTRWYAAGILLAIIVWLGTYKNKSLLNLHEARSRDRYGLDALRAAIQEIDHPQAKPPH